MQHYQTSNIDVAGEPCRVWRKGSGPKLGFLAGFGGLPKWIPFLDYLAQSHEVIVPSLPGFPGGPSHRELDNHLDWLLLTREIIDAAGLGGADLAASSVGAALAADVAAVWPASVRRLALIAPFGLFDPQEAPQDLWARRADALPGLLCRYPERFADLRSPPDASTDPIGWQLEQTRAVEASARLLFPLGDTRLIRRLNRITAPTLLVWGERDLVMPSSYARRFAQKLRTGSEVQIIHDAGHLAELDAPEATARAIREWLI